jgi:HSP20 family protein
MALPVRRNETQAERWDPLAELGRLNEQLQQYLSNWASLPSTLGEEFTPLADVEETEDAYLVEIELPGVKREDISVEVAGRRLTVSGERKERQRVGILRRRTRTVGRFHYEVVLPGDLVEDEVEASLDEGVLSLRVPKPERDRARRILVK